MPTYRKHPPSIIKKPVSQIRKIRGFHSIRISEPNAYAVLRGDKTATSVDKNMHIQKGDWIVFETHREPTLGIGRCFNELDNLVFEVSHVSLLEACSPSITVVCFRKIPGYSFHAGDINSEFKEDTIIH